MGGFKKVLCKQMALEVTDAWGTFRRVEPRPSIPDLRARYSKIPVDKLQQCLTAMIANRHIREQLAVEVTKLWDTLPQNQSRPTQSELVSKYKTCHITWCKQYLRAIIHHNRSHSTDT